MKLKSTLAMATLCLSGGVFAQVPQTERNVSMAMAQVIIAGAVEECAKTSYRVSVVIVDKAGQLAAALRGDGTSPATRPHRSSRPRRRAVTAWRYARSRASSRSAAGCRSGPVRKRLVRLVCPVRQVAIRTKSAPRPALLRWRQGSTNPRVSALPCRSKQWRQ